MPRAKLPIKTITLGSGATRYEIVVDVGVKADGVTRNQQRRRFKTYTEAKNTYLRLHAEVQAGTHVAATKLTVSAYIEQWLAGKRNIERTTLRGYRCALEHVKIHTGAKALQKLTKADLDTMVTVMLERGRRGRSAKSKKWLAGRTVNLTLTVLIDCLDDALKEGLVVRNVARLVDKAAEHKGEHNTWTPEQATHFLDYVSAHRLYVAFVLSLYGLRRAEVMGLCWQDVDLEEKTLLVRINRVMLGYEEIHKLPKSKKSIRLLPMDDDLVVAFKRLKAMRAADKLAAGPLYEKAACRERMWMANIDIGECGGTHVFIDELGATFNVERYSDWFEQLSRKAGLPRIRLHDARHTCGTVMHLRGVPIAIIAAWLGHADASFTLRTYVHPQQDELDEAPQTLAQIYGRTKRREAS